VTVHDRQNIRDLDPARIGRPVELVVADCSFISLKLVLDALPPFLGPAADVVALVKPQFEVGRDRVGKGGIVRDPAAHRDAIDHVLAHARALGFRVRGECRSPIEGKEGNVEFLVWLSWSGPGDTR
jgi:23S rRNA (cytidine1920-2'-O)/16S rRNA (cytidine1409-2'-O)-methyltransferase